MNIIIPQAKRSDTWSGVDPLVKRDQNGKFKELSNSKEVKSFSAKCNILNYKHLIISDKAKESSSIEQSIYREFVNEKLSPLCDPNLSNKHTSYITKTPINEAKLIKIIITPKAKTRLKKRHLGAKETQSTVSIPKSSTNKEHIYFSLKGKSYTKEKIYDIKTTGSDKLTYKQHNSKYENISIDRVANCKQLLETLNMEFQKQSHELKQSPQRNYYNGDSNIDGTRNRRIPIRNPNNIRSRARITGKLDRTGTDYVVNCTAEVNDNLNAINPESTNYSRCFWTKPTNRTSQDSSAQTNLCCSNMACISRFQAETQEIRTASQAIQVTLDVSNQKVSKKPTMVTPTTKAAIYANNIVAGNISDSKAVPLKESHSPLVIISVYPRKDNKKPMSPDDNNLVQKENSPRRKAKPLTFVPKLKHKICKSKEKLITTEKNKRHTTNYNNNIKIARSRLPLPPSLPNNVKKDSFFKKKTLEKSSKLNDNENVVNSTTTEQGANRVDCQCDFKLNHDINIQTNKTNKMIQKTDLNIKKVKQALIENFENDNDLNYFFHLPEENASKVTININDEHNHYDLILEQHNQNTDLMFRKMNKSKKSQKTVDVDNLQMNTKQRYLKLSGDKNSNISELNTKNIQSNNYISKTRPRLVNLNLRDSKEIYQSNEKKGVKKKVHHGYRTKNLKYEDIATMKHFRGDNCPIPDPNERDREIKELLGIVQAEKSNTPKNDLQYHPEIDNRHRKCSIKKTTGRLLQFTIDPIEKIKKNTLSCISLTPNPEKPIYAHKGHIKKKEKNNNLYNITTKKDIATFCENILDTLESSGNSINYFNTENIGFKNHIRKSFKDNENTPPRNAHITCTLQGNNMSQNMILNRNFQVFLQIEKLTKKKPIKLPKLQYDKLKKVIKSTISNKINVEKRDPCNFKNCSIVSVGEVKVRAKHQKLKNCSMETQTERLEKEYNTKFNQTNKIDSDDKMKNINTNEKGVGVLVDTLFKSEEYAEEKHEMLKLCTQRTVSSREICFANVAHLNNVTTSRRSNHCKPDASQISIQVEKDNKSIRTLFNGRKRSITPNLGTSVYSLCSDILAPTNIRNEVTNNEDAKQKKPFLRRLMSCLVMRSNQISNMKFAGLQGAPKVASVNSSVDSYNFSTSLGALEMSSDLYDTTASFYSNHTVLEVNKVKRGFFRSVRGFLTNRR